MANSIPLLLIFFILCVIHHKAICNDILPVPQPKSYITSLSCKFKAGIICCSIDNGRISPYVNALGPDICFNTRDGLDNNVVVILVELTDEEVGVLGIEEVDGLRGDEGIVAPLVLDIGDDGDVDDNGGTCGETDDVEGTVAVDKEAIVTPLRKASTSSSSI